MFVSPYAIFQINSNKLENWRMIFQYIADN